MKKWNWIHARKMQKQKNLYSGSKWKLKKKSWENRKASKIKVEHHHKACNKEMRSGKKSIGKMEIGKIWEKF